MSQSETDKKVEALYKAIYGGPEQTEEPLIHRLKTLEEHGVRRSRTIKWIVTILTTVVGSLLLHLAKTYLHL